MGVDASRAIRKLKRLKKAETVFAVNILQDAGAFFLGYLVDETLNGAYVNRITGMLVRSQTLRPIDIGIQISANLSIAPYAPAVAARTLSRFGKDYLNLTKFFTEPEIQKKAAAEFLRLGDQIDEDKKYNYRNPFR